ncbi:uncharacterized protein LOC132698114 [Cylas formicarius]|uniref:uncharacterized protein LOC132698114 n=1 Tax=Cylas formicarius TaxID=197179 RepID=UPI0029586F47|nr:uncharacterized protein LOC132698114 [Cylas formicarius]
MWGKEDAETSVGYHRRENWSHLENLVVSDDTYNTPGPIDALIGCELFPLILLPEKVCGKELEPVAFNTLFGWVVMVDCPLWWAGPAWLSRPSEEWPKHELGELDEPLPEERGTILTVIEPKMGDLPSFRITQAKPFQCTSLDFGGPFQILMARHRGCRTQKAYLSLFVCCSTKCLHLELVSDLSTSAFLASLRRFISRRGRCSKLHSDNGTNYVGAARYLADCMAKAAAEELIEWKFFPPSAPHFGGLHEAGIKSVKTHITKIIGEQLLTYEEFYTVLTQVEAVLNSRPLCAMSSDPNDLSSLTPGHFLSLAPLSAIPDHDLTCVPMNRLDRWQLLTKMHQSFWKRWHMEYLHSLQQRAKWDKDTTLITPGTLVVLKEDNLPPLQWRLGRIDSIHPGADGVPRVVTVRTQNGLIKRPVIKVCPLPAN